MDLYSKDGAYPAPLPDQAWGKNEAGEDWLYSPLAGFPASIKAAGYKIAPAQPEIDERTQQLGWASGKWKVEQRPAGEIVEALEALRSDLRSRLAATRWDHQQSFTYNGGPALADDVTIGRVVAKVFGAQIAQTPADERTIWKFGEGNFAEVTIAELGAYGLAIGAHVQACFDREAELAAAIDQASSFEELDAIDIMASWPDQ